MPSFRRPTGGGKPRASWEGDDIITGQTGRLAMAGRTLIQRNGVELQPWLCRSWNVVRLTVNAANLHV